MQMPVQITVEADIGYRSWRVEADGSLHAVFQQYEWPARQPAEAQSSDDGLGLHAWYRPEEAWQAFGDACDEGPHLYLVAGSVALFGDVSYDDDSDQYRATRAYPVELWSAYDPETNQRAALAAARYGIELRAKPLLLFQMDDARRDRDREVA